MNCCKPGSGTILVRVNANDWNDLVELSKAWADLNERINIGEATSSDIANEFESRGELCEAAALIVLRATIKQGKE